MEGYTHPLDRLLPNSNFYLLEALVPFVEPNMKKTLVLFIKINELQALMQSMDNIDLLSDAGFLIHTSSQEDMLHRILAFLPAGLSENLASMKTMMQMFSMAGSMTDFSSFSAQNNHSPQEMSPVSEPSEEQPTVSLFENIEALLKNIPDGGFL